MLWCGFHFAIRCRQEKGKFIFDFITIKLLKLSEASPVYLPEYKINEETKKTSLLNYCINDSVMKDYLPDKDKLTEISRSFLLMVRIINVSIAYLQ